MKAFYWEVKGKNDEGKKYFGVVLAPSVRSLFWVLDWSLDPYAVRFVELKGRSLFEFYGNPEQCRRDGNYDMRASMIDGEIVDVLTNWREFTAEGRSRLVTTSKEKT